MWQAELLLIILLLLLSGFFSGTEASFFALNRVQLRRLERHGEATSKLILEVLSKPNHFLTSVLVGNTLVNVALSVLTTSLFLRLLGDGGGLQVAILVTTVSVLLVGEVTPKTIAVNYPERVSRLTVRALRFVQVLLAPVIGAVTFVSDAILRLFGVEDGGIGHNSAISRGELGSLLEGADREGVMTARESWLAQNILEFSATRAEEAMIPRVDMVAASLEMDRDELEALVLGARRSRIPIYRNTIDEIEGYLPTKEFLLYPETKVSELVRPVAIFSERAFLSQIFYETQKGRTPVTILVNEYGETVGMLTREDLLEELVGEIHDEFGAKEDRFHRLGPGVFSASGQINIEELNEAAGLSIPDEDTVTLNGFLSALHGGIPVKGEEIVWNGVRFQIAEASRHRVQRVRVVVSPEEGGMNQILLYVLFILVGVAASAYFSATEISIISANRLKLRQQAKQGSAAASLALSLLHDQEHVLATTLIGLNLANLATAAFVTSLIEGWLGVGWRASLLSTGVATLVLLVMGEILPKVYASRHATTFVTRNARPIQATEQLFLPATAVIRLFLGLLLRGLRKAPQQPLVTREDLKHLVREVKGDTGHGRKEKKMLGSLLGFTETTAREVMVPMTEVIAIEKGSGISLARALAKRHGFTRLAVYERRIDKVTGVVNIKDILFDKDPDEQVAHYMRPALLVPETKRIDRLLVELQRSEQTMAIVVSEFGSCVGIVTLEDIVEEIVGEMAEEHEIGVRKIREIASGTYVVDALTDIDDLNDELGLELPKGRFDTLAGLLLKHYGRIPAEGERCRISEVEMEIVDAHQFGIGSVKLVLPNGSVERD